MLVAHPTRAVLVATLLLASAGAATAQGLEALRHDSEHTLPERRLYVATGEDFSTSGAAVAVDAASPWTLETLAPTDGGRLLRVFGSRVFVVNAELGTLTRFTPGGSQPPTVYELGLSSEPQDVHVIGAVAWVTRRHDPRLLRIHLPTGRISQAIDLGLLARAGETVALGTLERDGNRLFVQVTLTHEQDGPEADAAAAAPAAAAPPPFPDRGVLGVVDLSSETLFDVEPSAPGVQGIALDGAPPRLKMQILDEVRTLYVSSTGSLLDVRGGIEMVDLDRLESVGYALSEEQSSDLGGFVMTSSAGGYFVFHTEIVASTHLMPFTVAGGPGEPPEMIMLFGVVDSLAYDVQRQRIYLPSGIGSSGIYGLHALSTLTNLPLAASPLTTGLPPHDVVLVTE